MATIYKCDRCGTESDRFGSLTKIDIDWQDREEREWKFKRELCEKCMWQLVEWAKQGPMGS